MRINVWKVRVASAAFWLLLMVIALWKHDMFLAPLYLVIAVLDALLAFMFWWGKRPAVPDKPHKWDALYLQAYGFSGQSNRREFGAVVLSDLEGGFLVLTVDEFAGVAPDAVPTVIIDTTVIQLRGLVVSAGRAWTDFALPTFN